MTETVRRFQEDLNRLLNKHRRLCYATCAEELQTDACRELSLLMDEAGNLKEEVVKSCDAGLLPKM